MTKENLYTEGRQMYEATTAANEILRDNRARGRTTTPLQLIKLLYIAHGFLLAVRGKTLFSEPVQAWKFGPVIKSVYHKAKDFGRAPIPGDLPMLLSFGARTIDPDTKKIIGAVVDKWGNLSGVALSNWTHLPGSPWHQVFREDANDIVIPNELIQKYFSEIVRQNTKNAHTD